MDKKSIVVKIVGTGEPTVKDVLIEKRTTVADLKRTLSVPQSYQVLRESTETYLDNGQDLYKMLNDGEKLRIHPPSELGQ